MRVITTIIALLLAVTNINAQENMKENIDFNVWPKGELNTAYAKYFIGNSYLAPLDAENVAHPPQIGTGARVRGWLRLVCRGRQGACRAAPGSSGCHPRRGKTLARSSQRLMDAARNLYDKGGRRCLQRVAGACHG